jgi:hypothetical protein
MGLDGYVVASHILLICALLGLGHGAIVVRRHPAAVAAVLRSRAVGVASLAALAALVVERAYYVAARFAQDPASLWDAHPAPEALAVLVSLAVFALTTSLGVVTAPDRGRERRKVALAGAALAVAWGATVWLLV